MSSFVPISGGPSLCAQHPHLSFTCLVAPQTTMPLRSKTFDGSRLVLGRQGLCLMSLIFPHGSDKTLGEALTEHCATFYADTDSAGDFRGLHRACTWLT